MKHKFLLFISLILACFAAKAQVGIGTLTPNASAALDVQSTSKGLLVPRLTEAQRTGIASPAAGLIVYQTTNPTGFWGYISGQWVRLATTNDLPPAKASSFAANTSGSVIAVVLGGTDVPLPSDQNFSGGITVNGSDDEFTVPNSGRYRIAYDVNMTSSLLVSSRILVNGALFTASVVSPSLGVSHLHNEVIVSLAAGDTIGLQLFGFLGVVSLVSNAAGASLVIEQLD